MHISILPAFLAVCLITADSPAADTLPSGSIPPSLPGQIGQTIQLTLAPDGTVAGVASEVSLPPAMVSLDNRQPLNPGDRLTFRVIEDRDEPRPLVVTDSGELEVPYIGRMKVSGKTCLGVSKEVKVLLEKDYYYQATPLINIELLNRARGKVYVHGEVRTPGHQEIPPMRCSPSARPFCARVALPTLPTSREVIVTRKTGADGQQDQRIVIDVADILERGRTKDDIVLQAEDKIYVPDRTFNF